METRTISRISKGLKSVNRILFVDVSQFHKDNETLALKSLHAIVFENVGYFM